MGFLAIDESQTGATDSPLQETSWDADISVEVCPMKVRVYIAFLTCASLFAAAQTYGDSAARSNILALEYVWDQAQESRDVRALSAIFDNALVFVDYDGRILTKTEYLERVKSDSSHMEQIVTESMSVLVLGNTAIVVGTYRAKGIENGKPYLRRRRFVDTWMLMGERWVCVAAEATPIPH
jgi:ketosteroid isomerase-like protein